MLTPIDGTELPLTTMVPDGWRMPEYQMTLDYYDGARLVLRKDGEDLYLTSWNDEDEFTERWLYLNVTRERLGEILQGRITYIEALANPESRELIVLDLDQATGKVKRAVSTTTESVPEDSLPAPHVRIRIAMPDKDI